MSHVTFKLSLNPSNIVSCHLIHVNNAKPYFETSQLTLVHQNIVQIEPVHTSPPQMVPSCHRASHSSRRTNGRVNPYDASDARYIRKIERPVKKVTTPKSMVREQKIFSNETCQIVKVEPQ